jgi:hypothetical protein
MARTLSKNVVWDGQESFNTALSNPTGLSVEITSTGQSSFTDDVQNPYGATGAPVIIPGSVSISRSDVTGPVGNDSPIQGGQQQPLSGNVQGWTSNSPVPTQPWLGNPVTGQVVLTNQASGSVFYGSPTGAFNINFPTPVPSGGTVTVDYTGFVANPGTQAIPSDPFSLRHITEAQVQINVQGGNPTGIFTIQVSDDPGSSAGVFGNTAGVTHWSTLPIPTGVSVTAPGVYLLQITESGGLWHRLVYTPQASGPIAIVSATVNGKGPGF